nr:HSP17.8 [Paeonia suffruticosa]
MSIFQTLLDQRNFFNPFSSLFSETASMDWTETSQAHIFKIDLPGHTKEDVKLEIHEGRVLHLSAKREEEEEPDQKGHKWHCKERSRGDFSRQFRLPENVKVDEIKASVSDGVLTVTVPKDEPKKMKPKHKAVEIEQGRAPKGLSRSVCCRAP